MNDDESGIQKALVDKQARFNSLAESITEGIESLMQYLEVLEECKAKMGTAGDTKTMRNRMKSEISEANDLTKTLLDQLQDLEDVKFKNRKENDNKNKMLRRLNDAFEENYDKFTKLIKEIHSNEKKFVDIKQSVFDASVVSDKNATIVSDHQKQSVHSDRNALQKSTHENEIQYETNATHEQQYDEQGNLSNKNSVHYQGTHENQGENAYQGENQGHYEQNYDNQGQQYEGENYGYQHENQGNYQEQYDNQGNYQGEYQQENYQGEYNNNNQGQYNEQQYNEQYNAEGNPEHNYQEQQQYEQNYQQGEYNASQHGESVHEQANEEPKQAYGVPLHQKGFNPNTLRDSTVRVSVQNLKDLKESIKESNENLEFYESIIKLRESKIEQLKKLGSVTALDADPVEEQEQGQGQYQEPNQYQYQEVQRNEVGININDTANSAIGGNQSEVRDSKKRPRNNAVVNKILAGLIGVVVVGLVVVFILIK